MTTLNSFLQPLLIRFHERGQCFCCGGPAVKKCLTHGSKICDSAYCRMQHRRMKGSVSGDLTRPFCESRPLVSWKMHLLRTAVAVAVGLAVMALVAL